jgi:dihydrofolate reductase
VRRIIAALIMSVDGFIEGPAGELDWVNAWEDPFDLVPHVDTFLLGGGMYPGYERYWGAVMSDPTGALPFSGKVPTAGEIEYARFAERTPHVVLSRTLQEVSWPNTRIVRDVEEIRRLKAQPGGDMHAVGGATLVGALMNERLVDELRLVVNPIVLGGGKALFKDVHERHALTLRDAKTLATGAVRLTYTT